MSVEKHEQDKLKPMILALKEKAQYFFDEEIPVHVILRGGKRYSGRIHEIRDKFIVLLESRQGQTEVFYSEMLSLDRYKDKGNLSFYQQ